MATTIQDRIFNQATAGTPYNRGVPAVLASLMVAQAAHETGNFTSNFFRNYNNAFGYSYFRGSPYQSGSGTLADNGLPIAVYRSVEDSVKEVVDWIYRRQKEGKFPADLGTIRTPEQYAKLLKDAGYYGDTLANYTAGLKRFFVAVIEELKKPGTQTAGAIFLILVAWLIFRRR